MRRQLFRRDPRSAARLAFRLERAAARINPFLLVVVIGLALLDVTCFIALKISPPKPVNFDAAIAVPASR